MQVAPNVFQLKIPLPDRRLNTLNAYLIKSEDGALLIDTGWNTDEAYQALVSQLAELDLTPQDLKYVVITHFHPDHYGLIERLSQKTHALFVQHDIEYKLLKTRRNEAEISLHKMETWLEKNGMPHAENSELTMMTTDIYNLGTENANFLIVQGGESLQFGGFNFEIVWAPGHSPGMICLYEAQKKLLFCSDHVLAHTTPNISLFMENGGNPLRDYLQSLRKVGELPVELTFPAHGKLIYDLPTRVDEMIQHHEDRLKEMITVCQSSACSAYQIASHVTWSMSWQKMGAFHHRFALTETLAHLELLRTRGLIEKIEDDQGIFYRRLD